VGSLEDSEQGIPGRFSASSVHAVLSDLLYFPFGTARADCLSQRCCRHQAGLLDSKSWDMKME
jgi:hypothetical protein